MTKLQQVERKLRKKIERLMEMEGVTLVRRGDFGTSSWNEVVYRPNVVDCGVCVIGAVLIGTRRGNEGWMTEDAARVLGITSEEARAISYGFEGYLTLLDSPYYVLGDRLRRDYCVEERR